MNMDGTVLAGAQGFGFQIQGQPMCLPSPLEVQPCGCRGLSQVVTARHLTLHHRRGVRWAAGTYTTVYVNCAAF